MVFPRIKQKYSCGCCAVRFLVKHFEGEDIPEKDLVSELKTNPEGMTTLPRHIIKYLRGRGYTVKPRHGMTKRMLLNALNKNSLVITPFWNHYYVLLSMDDKATFFDGINGRLEMDTDEFFRSWIDKDSSGTVYDCYGIVVAL